MNSLNGAMLLAIRGQDTKLLDEKRADYRPHVFEGNRFLVAQKKPRREWSPPQVIADQLSRPDGSRCHLHSGVASRGRFGRGYRHRTPRQSLGKGATVSRRPRSRCRRFVPPLADHPVRSGVPRGQRGCVAHGMAAHSTAGLAGRRGRRSCPSTRPFGSAWALAGRTARFGKACVKRDQDAPTPRDRRAGTRSPEATWRARTSP